MRWRSSSALEAALEEEEVEVEVEGEVEVEEVEVEAEEVCFELFIWLLFLKGKKEGFACSIFVLF